MQLVETHCHTREVSLCARVPAADIPAMYKTAGYGTIIVTDHYNHWTLAELASDRSTQIDRWLDGYRAVKDAGDAVGITVLLGMELALPDFRGEFLVYGAGEEFLHRYPGLVEISLERVCEIAAEEGLLLYQAHPFRENMDRAPARLLQGVEVHNGNPRHDSRNGLAAGFARDHGLRRIAGSDFHQAEDLGRGGIWLPEGIGTNGQLVEYLKANYVEIYSSTGV